MLTAGPTVELDVVASPRSRWFGGAGEGDLGRVAVVSGDAVAQGGFHHREFVVGHERDGRFWVGRVDNRR
jgi:hypothetical protein